MKPISRISEEELDARLNAVRAMIRRARKTGDNTIDAEIELCWLQREKEVRDIRIVEHEKYINNLKKQWAEEEDAENEFFGDSVEDEIYDQENV